MGEKTEKASPKKLRDAMKKGQVAKSQDFPAAATFITSVVVTLWMIPTIYEEFSKLLVNCFSLVTDPHVSEIIGPLFIHAAFVIFITSLPIILATCGIGMLVTFLTVGPVWAPEVFKFDIKKFNPIENLKSKFKMKTLIELLKSLLKITIAAYIVFRVVMEAIPTLVQSQTIPLLSSLNVFIYFLTEVVKRVGLFFAAVAIADFGYQKWTFAQDMKMEKFEVKQEYKETEGNPEIKGRRREVAREIAYSESPAAGAAKANAIVSNPHMLAIALGFDRELDPCPFILAMGQGPLALEIIKIAESRQIPVVRNIPLAHTLWEKAKLYEYIPEETYEPVAEIMRWLAEIEHEEQIKALPF
jgi:type III secretion protein U